jgi:hypothetical protein
MQIVEKIETLVKFSESSTPKIFIICGIMICLLGFLSFLDLIVKGYSNTIIKLNTTMIITGVLIAGIGFYKPTLLDTIIPKSQETHYETNVDKSKYELSIITNNNEKYLKFDNKGDNNIQIRNNNKKVNTDIFKIVAENDNEYLLEYEVVDKGFFSDTVKQERSSLTKK